MRFDCISNTLSDKYRLIVVLDSLTNLSISKPYGQDHTVGMRIFFDQKENKVRTHLIFFGNDDVPKVLINHISYIWKTILELSVKTAIEVEVRAIQDHKVIEWNTCWKCRLWEYIDDIGRGRLLS